jgi:hypothetical protein
MIFDKSIREFDSANINDGSLWQMNKTFRVGDWVEVRSKSEILATLDKRGQHDGMPFMPEMLQFCGQRFQIYKSAHKTCDTVFPVRGRKVDRCVHLETRCDGQAHGNCDATCLIFWKEEWLKSVTDKPKDYEGQYIGPDCAESHVWDGTKAEIANDELIYVCQATQLPYATTALNPWNLSQYIQDYTSGNVDLRRILHGFVYMGYNTLINAGIGLGPILRFIYDAIQQARGGIRYPRRNGVISAGKLTPAGNNDLQQGELVRVKSYEEILATLDQSNRNRGLVFDAEMVPYCGGIHRVLKRVSRIIDEKTGKIIEIKNSCIILESVVCQSRYSECRLFCPRSIYPYWREIWLERVTG